MNIIVNIDKNTLANKQPKIYDLGEVTTSVQDLLDNSTITITNNRLVILRFTDLDLSVKQGFLILNDYTEGDKYGLGQNILESDLIYFSSGPSGDFIPLSGTEVGNPITGNLQFDGSLMLYNTDYSTQAAIGIIPSALQLGVFNQSNKSNSSASEVLLQDGIIKVRTDDSLGLPARGISSDYDYTPNITELDYTQKIYVDGLRGKHISKTTTEINAIVTPQAGETYFNTTLSTLCFWDRTAWKKVIHLAM